MDPSPHDTILYPESHLNSPIVAQRLVAYLEYSLLPHNQVLSDETVTANIRNRISTFGIPLHLRVLQTSGHIVSPWIAPRGRYNHVPYPECNSRLFKYSDPKISKRLEQVLAHANNTYSSVSDKITKCLTDVRHSLGLHQLPRDDEENIGLSRIMDLPDIMISSQWYDSFLFWFTLKTEMRSCLKIATPIPSNSSGTPVVIRSDGTVIVINRYLLYMISHELSEVFYLTFEMVLMMCDVVEGRLMCEVAMAADPKYGSLIPHVKTLWIFIDGLFPDLGNNTYNIVSLLEPLTLGFLQLKDEAPILAGAFLEHCLSEVTNELISNGFTDEYDIREVLRIIRTIFSIDDIHMLAEMFSFFRSFGHPILEAEEAAEKVREHMHKPKLISFEVMMKGHALFCATIINGYRDRHGGAWPPVQFPDHISNPIRSAQLNNEAITDAVAVTNWKSFCGVQFGCFLPLSLDEDLTMYMKDKALAAIAKEWDSPYPIEVMNYRPPKQTTSRRLVDVFINDPKFDPYDMITYVTSGEYLHDPDFNLSYSLKEKETKKVGRLFAKMSYKMRACQVIAESLIANGVGSYFKDNGMSKDEHELAKTLHRLSISSVPRNNKYRQQVADLMNRRNFGPQSSNSNNRGSVNHDYVQQGNVKGLSGVVNDNNAEQYETISTFLTTDLQKFCLNWRAETINIFAERLNEIYGLPGFFQWLHKRLEISNLYVCDPYCPPKNDHHIDINDNLNEHIFIKHPMGGIEGFNQKLWTIATIPFLYLSAYETGLRISSVVQGDNEAIAITKRVPSSYPYWLKKQESAEAARVYFHQLRHNFAMIGHNLKANETLISSHFFIYSKQIYYDGVVLSQALKSIARCVFWSETIVDETRSACSNIATTITKSIEKGYSRNVGYALCILKTIQQLMIALDFTINPHMTPDIKNPILGNRSWLIHAALTPAPLGGFNYINMSRIYVRNIGDPVTASLADVKRLTSAGILAKCMIQKIMNQPPGDSTFLDWANDPYSANIPNTQSITKMIKNITARNILIHSPNPMLRGLFHDGTAEEDHKLAAFLMDRSVIIPRAAHEIIDNSISGAREQIAGMLDTTKGLIRSGLRMGGLKTRLITRIATYDVEQFKRFNTLMNVQESNPLIENDACSVALARALRQHMWGYLTYGRPIYGLEVPDIIEAMRGTFITGHEDCNQCASGSPNYAWFFVPSGCDLDDVHNPTNAIRVPYVGSSTDERSDIKVGHVRNPSKALKAAIRIAMIYTWAFGDSDESWAEAWNISSQRAALTLDDLKLITPISTSTNLAHRMRDRSTQIKYSSSSLNRAARYTTISNDNLNFIIDGVKTDTNYVYQQGMLLGISVIEDFFRYENTTGLHNTVLHLHTVDSCCIIRMTDHPNVASTQSCPIIRPPNNNKLIYDASPIIEKDQIKLDQQRYRVSLVDFTIWSTSDLEKGLAQSLSLTLIELITKSENDHLNELKTVESDDDIKSLITEFLLVNPKLFSLYLGQAIAVNWSFEIHYRRPAGIYQMVELLHKLLMRTSHGSLTVLSNALSHKQIYRRLWDADLIEPTSGHLLDQQNLVVTAIELLVECYSIYLHYWLSTPTSGLQYIICEADEDVLNSRYDVVQAKHLAMLNDLYNTSGNIPAIRGLAPIQKCKVLRDALMKYAAVTNNALDWNLSDLEILAYPASLTYIRRGTIKQLRMRSPQPNILALAETKQHIPIEVLQMSITPHQNLEEMPPSVKVNAHDIIPKLGTLKSGPVLPSSRSDLADYGHHIFRRVGLNSTSAYKAVEITECIKGRFDHAGTRLFLAEGSGAMLTTYYYLLGAAKCYYNTGVFTDAVRGQREFAPYPAEVALVSKANGNNMSLTDNISILFNGKPESTWIGNLECFSYILNQVKLGTCSLVHCDMEGVGDKTSHQVLEEMCHVISLALAVGEYGSCFVLKMMPLGQDWSAEIIRVISEHYDETLIYIPWFSNPDSTEVYVIGIGLKNNQVIDPTLIYSRLSTRFTHASVIFHNWVVDTKHLLVNSYLDSVQFPLLSDQSFINLHSYLSKLTKVEQALITIGFQLNGPKIFKRLIGHDPSHGTRPIVAGVVMSYKELLYTYTSHKSEHHFFQPYPVLEESRIRELVTDIVKKFHIIQILEKGQLGDNARSKLAQALRRQQFIFDLSNHEMNTLCPKYIYNKLIKAEIKKQWIIPITTPEAKMWWKAIGYSVLMDPVP
ncbi:large protein [Mossman virus]|uniref:RNA-directed RNA polymerase L n=1 Tax=Mossman virus TaxID=241630 RepID=Q6WGL9_9MONO|nr:large protein [Mossman virus]AAQ23993.1 large protein [Mossman virus]